MVQVSLLWAAPDLVLCSCFLDYHALPQLHGLSFEVSIRKSPIGSIRHIKKLNIVKDPIALEISPKATAVKSIHAGIIEGSRHFSLLLCVWVWGMVHRFYWWFRTCAWQKQHSSVNSVQDRDGRKEAPWITVLVQWFGGQVNAPPSVSVIAGNTGKTPSFASWGICKPRTIGQYLRAILVNS